MQSLSRVLFSVGVVLLAGSATSERASANSLGGPLNLADEGTFFVGGTSLVSTNPGASPAGPSRPGTVIVNQMFVHYRIPVQRTNPMPIVLVHGGGLTGVSYETTPDGREGWATYLARKGYAVYVVDTPGRGRSGFNATAINQAKAESSVAALPGNVLMVTAELAWPLFRFGPTSGTAFPDTQYPTEAFAAFGSQGVPFGEATLEGGAMATAPRALAALLDKIGPAVVVVHSLAGPFADALVRFDPSGQGGGQHRRCAGHCPHRGPDRSLSGHPGARTVRRPPGCSRLYRSRSLRRAKGCRGAHQQAARR